ncbi:MAG TPA: hypothetical protein VEB64_02075 [Azospirillaceae bacterium]|nr:hypothetical protein [Azospirillaceae bacterium]
MAKLNGRIRLSDVLEPVLTAAEADEAEVDRAVGLVAEALAALELLVVDQHGQPVAGASDELAVLGALNTYGRMLVRLGQLEDAMDVAHLMERIKLLEARPLRRPPRTGWI